MGLGRRRTRTERRERPAGWDDPFDDYGSGADGDDLGLAGLRDAARGPLTPISGAGRSTPVDAVPGPGPGTPSRADEAARRVDADHMVWSPHSSDHRLVFTELTLLDDHGC